MSSVEHPRHALDRSLLNPVRLSIVAALAEVDRAEFSFVRDSVQISGSLLSKQVALLEAAGYVGVTKARSGRYGRTWLLLTPTGLDVYHRHVDALRTIAVGDADDWSHGRVDAPHSEQSDSTTRVRS